MRLYTRKVILSEEPIWVNIYDETRCRGEHMHDFLEIEYILAGKGKHILNGKSFTVNPGDLFFTNMGTSHYFESSKKDPIIVYNCVFNKYLCQALGTKFPRMKQDFHIELLSEQIAKQPYIRLWDKEFKIRSLLDEMHFEIINKNDNYQTAMLGGLIKLNLLISRMYAEQQERVYKRTYIYDVIKYIDGNYKSGVSLSKLAEIAYVSPNYLSKKFKEYVGISISKYIQKARINYACTLIRESDKSITEIVSEVGYSDEKTFREVFKALIGKTPTEYKKDAK